MTAAAAMLDADAGALVGYAAPNGSRPTRVNVEIGGETAMTVLALGPLDLLTDAAWATLGPPPNASCSFRFKLPRGAGPGRLRVIANTETVLCERDFADQKAYARFEEGQDMAESYTLEINRLDRGVFRGRLVDHGQGSAPEIVLKLRGQIVCEARIKPLGDHQFDVVATLPPEVIGDGVSVVDFALKSGGVLTSYSISAGEALVGDLATEVASLRSELDQIKTAFREAMSGGVLAKDDRPMIVAEVLTHVDNLLELRDRSAQQEPILSDDDDEVWEDVD